MASNPLKTYRQRRGLKKTVKFAEPFGTIAKNGQNNQLFVIQKHDASHLHYDFRLEVGGVLKSWAVPKGLPDTLNVRRLAMPTDDHPMEYADFEGIIPEGHYGGGTVMVWDTGTYVNIKQENGKIVPMKECYKRGTIEVFLQGKKLWGPYALIKTKGLSNKESWIILKMKKGADLFKRTGKKILKKDVSALSGRTMSKIALDKDAVWDCPNNPSDDPVKVGSRSIELSNQSKVWFPESKITKGQIVDYYNAVGPYIVAHIKNHPLTVQRFPNGISEQSFYQKNAGSYFPKWIKTTPIAKEEGGKVHYVLPNDTATLVYLANQGALTFHAWLSRYDKLDAPDRLVFDFDPSKKNDFSDIRTAALLAKEIFDQLDIPCFAMTTGSRGMHVVVPLKRVHTFDQIARFAYAIAQEMIKRDPKKYTLEVRKEKRGGKIFIDTLRNRFSATSVAPYSVRPHENAPVATPLKWAEVHDPKLTSQKFTIKTIIPRLQKIGDPWEKIDSHAVSLLKFLKKIE